MLKKVLAKEPISQSINSIEPGESNVVEEQSLQETSYKLQSNANKVLDTNNKQQKKVGESIKSSQNGSLSKVLRRETAKPASTSSKVLRRETAKPASTSSKVLRRETAKPASTSSKTSSLSVKPVFERSKIETEKPPNQSKETLSTKKSPKEQASKKPFIQQDSTKREQQQPKKAISLKLLKYWIWGLIVIPILLIMAIALVRFWNRPKPKPTSASTPVRAKLPEIKKVAALGRIEPQGEIMSLSAPTSLEAVQVEQILVQTGDRVKKRQIIAILDGRQRQQATLDEAKTRLTVAQFRLEKVKAGAKQGAIGAREAAIANIEAQLAGEAQTQKATIAKLTAELDNAQTEFQRNQQLFNQGAISASELDSKKLTFKTAQEQLNEARASLERTERTLNARLAQAQATLEETAEVRTVDI
ncbi:MAG: hypothetical protein ACRC2S_00095, partial [Waterburya sp.]